MMTDLWVDPPVNPRLHVYVFNVTNHEAFLSGQETEINIKEIGPYVYVAPQRKKILHYSDDQSAVTFQSKIDYEFLPEESGIGLNDRTDFVNVPNLLLMTGMLKSEVKNQPDFIKSSVVWPVLTSAGYKTPFIKLSVAEFLWGYEDELACLDSNPKDDENDIFSDFNDDDFFESDPQDNDQEVVPKKKNFRRPDGKCVFGALVERNGTWDRPVSMLTGFNGLTDKGRILNIAGSPNFDVWEKGSSCDRVSGSFEPSSLPPTEDLGTVHVLILLFSRVF